MDQLNKRNASGICEDKTSTKNIAISKMFTFVVGPNETDFTIHSALVAKQSPVLNVLINGPFKEALEQRVEWNDLEETIFLSFWEFAYTGDYANPIQEDDEQEETDPVDEGLSNWSKSWAHYVRHYPPFSGPNSRLNGMWQDFVDKYSAISRPSDVGNIGESTLLHHAQVCVFADRYAIDALMEVSLGKLFIALEAIIPWGSSWDSNMELLILASGKFVPLKLREIVADYILTQAELFKNQEVFQHFMSNHGGPMQGLLRHIFEPEDDE